MEEELPVRLSQAERRHRSEQKLLDAALALVAERGTTRMTLAAVGERAGLSRGLIYHHWGNQDEDGSQAFSHFLSAVSEAIYASTSLVDDLGEVAESLPANLSDVILALSLFEMERTSGDDRTMFRASQALTKLTTVVQLSESRENPLLRFLNVPLAYSVHVALAAERWRSAPGRQVRAWLETIAELDRGRVVRVG